MYTYIHIHVACTYICKISVDIEYKHYTYLAPKERFTVHSAYCDIDNFFPWEVGLHGRWRWSAPGAETWQTGGLYVGLGEPSPGGASHVNHPQDPQDHQWIRFWGYTHCCMRYLQMVAPGTSLHYGLALLSVTPSLAKPKCVFLFLLSSCHVMMNVQYMFASKTYKTYKLKKQYHTIIGLWIW